MKFNAVLFVLVFLAACAAPHAPSPIPTEPLASTVTTTPVPPPNTIVFYSNRDGSMEIYSMMPDGSNQTRLTDNAFEDSSPAWSPDGEQIVFITDRDDPDGGHCFPKCHYQLYTMRSDGSQQERLVATEFSTQHPDWHPDGSSILFDSEFNLEGDLYLLDLAAGAPELLIPNAFWGDWSPDGSQIAYVGLVDGVLDLYIANADGSEPYQLTDTPAMEFFPAWSPDGTQIAYMAGTVGQRNIFVINADVSDEQQLTTAGGISEDPTWSPDGSQIAFQANWSGPYQIYLMNADGSESHPITELGENYWANWGAFSQP